MLVCLGFLSLVANLMPSAPLVFSNLRDVVHYKAVGTMPVVLEDAEIHVMTDWVREMCKNSSHMQTIFLKSE